MFFETLRDILLAHIRERVRSGELSERGLARNTGISQPHIHNVLKGVRSLSVEYADRLLIHLHLSIPDLFREVKESIDRPLEGTTVEIPLYRGQVGPGHFLSDGPFPGHSYPVAKLLTSLLTDPILVTLGHDPSLFPYFQQGDIALVTRDSTTPEMLDPLALYLVKTQDGTLVRLLRTAGARLYLITPATRDEPRNWSQLALLGRGLDEIISGKLVGFCRRLQGEPFESAS